jgi:hypothetical protein
MGKDSGAFQGPKGDPELSPVPPAPPHPDAFEQGGIPNKKQSEVADKTKPAATPPETEK